MKSIRLISFDRLLPLVHAEICRIESTDKVKILNFALSRHKYLVDTELNELMEIIYVDASVDGKFTPYVLSWGLTSQCFTHFEVDYERKAQAGIEAFEY